MSGRDSVCLTPWWAGGWTKAALQSQACNIWSISRDKENREQAHSLFLHFSSPLHAPNDELLIDLLPIMGFPGGSDSKEFTCNAGDLGSIPRLGRSPRGGHGNPLQYSCLENPQRQRSLAGYSPWGHKELDMTERLSTLPITTNDIMWFSGHWWWAWPSRAWPNQDLGSPLFPGGKEPSDSLVWSLDLGYIHLVNVMFL